MKQLQFTIIMSSHMHREDQNKIALAYGPLARPRTEGPGFDPGAGQKNDSISASRFPLLHAEDG